MSCSITHLVSAIKEKFQFIKFKASAWKILTQQHEEVNSCQLGFRKLIIWSIQHNKKWNKLTHFPYARPAQSQNFSFSPNFYFLFSLSHHGYVHGSTSNHLPV